MEYATTHYRDVYLLTRLEMDHPVELSVPRKFSEVPPGGMSMLELSTRPWLFYLSQKYGKDISTLSDIPDQELQAIANKSYDMLWMMG
jgi:hypothetical protein